MEEMHRTHKDVPFGWVQAIDDWRKSRTRRRMRAARGVASPPTR